MAAKSTPASPLAGLVQTERFVSRHLGPRPADIEKMLKTVGYKSMDDFIDAVIPEDIRLRRPLALAPGRSEREVLQELRRIAAQNQVFRSYIGMGYSGTFTPQVIQRNILENPGWYTAYTPYQAEIAQGRLEALLNFQTVVADLTGLPVANASLLDEATAAAEAMYMTVAVTHHEGTPVFMVDSHCHPQTIAVVQTRAEARGIDVVVADPDTFKFTAGVVGALIQYPATDGAVRDHRKFCEAAHAAGALVTVATDLLALTLLVPPGEFGADIAIGNSQRFGVPMGFGGPHAAYISTKNEYARKMPGRIIGVSKDAQGNVAYRMAIQTREQHIKREKATSNICTAQALLAIMAGMYAVYHGPEGLKAIAHRVHRCAVGLAKDLQELGHKTSQTPGIFDTVRVWPKCGSAEVMKLSRERSVNLRDFGDGSLGISCDETTSREDMLTVLECFSGGKRRSYFSGEVLTAEGLAHEQAYRRASSFLTHPVFNTYHSETEMLRYIFKLQGRDLSLAQSMISLGSCTMKLNATSEMIPVTWPEFGRMHPFAPADQTKGYRQMFAQLERWLAEITGFAAVSLQPNAGSQGEYAGLCVIRAYHQSRGDGKRDVCLIPDSAHGTNPASAVIAGMKVVSVDCDERGNIDIADLRKKADEHAKDLAALMVTYPSTHGVFEEGIREICEIVHSHGGQVYMDGANMNAQVGLTSPGHIGADVCHLNLHKTFCIPHGGGGPGMGPIGVAKHLAPFLSGHPVVKPDSAGEKAIGPISAAPYGSPSILTISWVYIALMGAAGLKKATQVAILNANYMAKRLEGHYPILYRGTNGTCAHEFILDCRPFEASAGIKVDDIAKRLMDYGFHAPTMSFPVPGTLMIEPTESESKAELDRFCDAMIGIREEIRAIEQGKMDRVDNPLKNAPHTALVIAGEWERRYTREQACFPAPWTKDHKFWPAVGRIDNPYGDRNLVCTCPPVSEFA